MSKRFKRDLLPKSKIIKKKKKNLEKHQTLGLGPKFIESVSSALRDGDNIHVRKMVEGLSEYGLANLIEALNHSERAKLVKILGDKINPDVFPELNDVVQEQVLDSLQEKQIVKIANELDSDEVVEILEHMDEDEQESISTDNYEDMHEILEMLNTHLTKIEEHGNSTSRILKAMEEMLSDHSCHFAETDLNKLILNNLEVLKQYYQKEIQANDIRVIFEPFGEKLVAQVDALQLGKALMSMMQNSVHALCKKKAKMAYEAEMRIHLEKEGDKTNIHLWDNGIGIESNIMDKIFDPFFTTKTTAEAAGVGLYLSREIILNHNGSVEVKSQKDEYTEFILSIPIHQSSKHDDDE